MLLYLGIRFVKRGKMRKMPAHIAPVGFLKKPQKKKIEFKEKCFI
jgi:hypothetical protein